MIRPKPSDDMKTLTAVSVLLEREWVGAREIPTLQAAAAATAAVAAAT